MDYWEIGIENIYNKTNYDSIINIDFNEKEKNVANAIIVRNTWLDAFMIDLISLILIFGIYQLREES